MTVKPTNRYVLCKKIVAEKYTVDDGLLTYVKEDVPQYRVIDVADDLDSSIVKTGDMIMINSTGTVFELDGSEYCLVNVEHLAATLV